MRKGPGTVGSTALSITKSLTIRGAGADKVTIEPKHGQRQPDRRDPTRSIRNGKGVIISAKGDPNSPDHRPDLRRHRRRERRLRDRRHRLSRCAGRREPVARDRSRRRRERERLHRPRWIPQQRVRDRNRRRDARSAPRQREPAADRSADDHHRPHAHRELQRGRRSDRRRDGRLLALGDTGDAPGNRPECRSTTSSQATRSPAATRARTTTTPTAGGPDR